MPNKPELLPCPFCGQMPEVTREQHRTSISCANKYCVGYFGVASKVHADENIATSAAIAAWNAAPPAGYRSRNGSRRYQTKEN